MIDADGHGPEVQDDLHQKKEVILPEILSFSRVKIDLIWL